MDVHYGIEVIDPFGIGLTGHAKVSLLKDRPGMVQVHAGKRIQGRAPIGRLVMASDRYTHEIRFNVFPQDERPDASGRFRPTTLMERVSDFLARAGAPCSKTAIREGVQGKEEYVRQAVNVLVEEGYVGTIASGRYPTFILIKPYIDMNDPLAVEQRPESGSLRRAGE